MKYQLVKRGFGAHHAPRFFETLTAASVRCKVHSGPSGSDSYRGEKAMRKSAYDNLIGAVLTLVTAVLTILVGVFIYNLVSYGKLPEIPGVATISGATGDAARQVATSPVLLPLALMALWLNVSRASAHSIPDWSFFWWVDFLPSLGLGIFLLIVVPAMIINGNAKMPDFVNLGIYILFLFSSIFDVIFNGRHRVEHAQSPIGSKQVSTFADGEVSSVSAQGGGQVTIQHADTVVIADDPDRRVVVSSDNRPRLASVS